MAKYRIFEKNPITNEWVDKEWVEGSGQQDVLRQVGVPGIHTIEPTFGLPATWIDENLREEATFRGYTIVDRIGTRILRDPYTNKPYVGFYTTKRVGGGCLNTEAVKAQNVA